MYIVTAKYSHAETYVDVRRVVESVWIRIPKCTYVCHTERRRKKQKSSKSTNKNSTTTNAMYTVLVKYYPITGGGSACFPRISNSGYYTRRCLRWNIKLQIWG